jgi:hypothetical protein
MRLQVWFWRHCIEAAQRTIPVRTVVGLDQGQAQRCGGPAPIFRRAVIAIDKLYSRYQNSAGRVGPRNAIAPSRSALTSNTIDPKRASRLLDHLVGGGQKRFRDYQAERFSRVQIDEQLDLGRLLDRQIAWLVAPWKTGRETYHARKPIPRGLQPGLARENAPFKDPAKRNRPGLALSS